jgi:hypothetical protein
MEMVGQVCMEINNVEPQEPQKATSLREFFQDRGLINKT